MEVKKFARHHKKIIIGVLILLVLIASYFSYSRQQLGNIFVLSISSDGNYVISTDDKRRAVLWDIKNKTYKTLDRTANVYSAYFIKNTNYVMWQHDANNEVRIANTDGKVIQKFIAGFPTYGQVMTTDLKNYIASDEDWNLYLNDKKIMRDEGGFLGAGKLYNLTLSSDDKYLLGSGDGGGQADLDIKLVRGKNALEGNYNHYQGLSRIDGVVLWSVSTGQPLIKFDGNVSQTFSTLSPDGKYVISGDVDDRGYVWDAATGKEVFRIWDIWFGIPIKQDAYGTTLESNKKGLITVPNDFKDSQGQQSDHYVAIKFIDATHYLRFTYDVPYAILYSITDPKPLKYLKLNTTPYPSIDDYSRDQSIDTSPSAHILVIGHRDVPGITVYQYEPKTETLNMIWNVE